MGNGRCGVMFVPVKHCFTFKLRIMKDQKQDKQQQENESKRRDDIRNSEKANEEQRVNHPGNDRVAKTNRSGMGQQQDSSGHPINS